MFNELLVAAAGLGGFVDYLVSNWIGPVFFIIIIVGAIMLAHNRSWMKLVTLIAFGAIVGFIIYSPETLFGEGSIGTDIADEVANQIN